MSGKYLWVCATHKSIYHDSYIRKPICDMKTNNVFELCLHCVLHTVECCVCALYVAFDVHFCSVVISAYGLCT